jgi:predicted PurR-regulated permease PerM
MTFSPAQRQSIKWVGLGLLMLMGVNFTRLAIFIPYLGLGIGLILPLSAGALQFGGAYGLIAVAVVYRG